MIDSDVTAAVCSNCSIQMHQLQSAAPAACAWMTQYGMRIPLLAVHGLAKYACLADPEWLQNQATPTLIGCDSKFECKGMSLQNQAHPACKQNIGDMGWPSANLSCNHRSLRSTGPVIYAGLDMQVMWCVFQNAGRMSAWRRPSADWNQTR